MGFKLKCHEFKLRPNQEKDVIICLEKEERAAIHGVVVIEGVPVKDAIVKLFKKTSSGLVPITFTFTDACGQFLFGVESCVEYVIKVFFYVPEKVTPPEKCGCDNKCDCD